MIISPKVAAFCKKYGVTEDKLWLLPGGRAHAIYHSELQRIALQEGISFAAPEITISTEYGICFSGYGSMGEVSVWSTGEASPKNCKNPYFYAMAEKRWKDRLILILTGVHGTGGLYSEDEADDFGDAGERSPPGQDAIEKGYHHIITLFCTDRPSAEEFYLKNKGMIQQFRKNFRDRVLEQLKIISEKGEAA